MPAQEEQIKLPFPVSPDNGDVIHPVLEYPVVHQLLSRLKPELLDGSPYSMRYLDRIAAYLGQSRRKILDPDLRRFLPEDVCTVLYGLKTLLQGRNQNIVSWVLEDHKAQFGKMIQQFVDEEE